MSQSQTHTHNPPPAPPTNRPMPRARAASGVAPLQANNAELLHLVLFIAGAVLLPLGLVVIGLGWYGVSHTPYAYDQMSYLISGGILGLGITFCGGFLYFGAWLARVAADQKEASKKLSDTLLLLADAVSHSSAGSAPAAPGFVTATQRDPGSVLVVAGGGTIVHRADCDLVADRDDLQPAGPNGPGLTACRLCQPGTGH